MLSDEVLEKVTERIVERLSILNTNILKHIGSKIDEIGKLKPTQAQQLIQTLKYGGDYEKIVKELSRVSKLNTKEIKEIFEEVAKNDYRFAKQFYDYRGIGYIPYDENVALQNEVKAIANITARRCAEMMTPRALGFGMIDKKTGEVTFKGLKKAYYDLLDEAVLSVSQGKESFDQAMTRQIKQMGSGGLKVIYESTYINKEGKEVHNTRRLDSAIRMNLKDSLRELHNETQAIFGEEFNADGVEISVHGNPAPDHELVQGRQFSNTEFNKFQNDEQAISYDGVVFEPEFEGHDRRSISEYNCYHYTFSIVLGVSEPEYTNEQLQEIVDRNNEGFEIDGKHYTRYEGTQMQRSLETEIRKQKDIQIMAKASGQDDLVLNSQQKITQLTQKYKELSKVSGLPTKMERMKVSGYTLYGRKREENFKNSLVRDEKGNLLKMYHGTTVDFKEFDINKIREVDYDAPFNGFWFSSDKDTSPAMMNAIYTKEVELNVTNPAPYSVWKDVAKKAESEYYDFYSKNSFDNNTKIPTFDARSRSTNDEVRYRLEKMGYDGIHWNGKPVINIKELEETGKTKFTTAGGRGERIMEKVDGEYVLEYSNGEHITSFGSVEEYINMQDEEWVVFDPKQIKILKQNIKK